MREGEPYIEKVVLQKHGDQYPYNLPVFQNLASLYFAAPVTFFVGENGIGKSTLLEAMALCAGFNPEGGSKHHNFSTMDTHSELHNAIRLIRGPYRERDGFFLRAEGVYNLATNLDEMDEGTGEILAAYGGQSLHTQSHGESFLSILQNRCRGRGLYLLDEPEAALSPTSQMALLCRMKELVEQQSQFVIATHSPILMTFPGAQIFVFSEEGIHETPYQETEHYLLTKKFLNHTDQMLRMLFDGD